MSNTLRVTLAAGLAILSIGSLALMTAPASAQGWNRGDYYNGDYYRGDNYGDDNYGDDNYRGGYYPNGSYLRTCGNVRINGGLLTADCADRNGRYRQSAISYRQCVGDIGNRNGLLNCDGARAREAYGNGYNDWQDSRDPYSYGPGYGGGQPWSDFGRY